MVDDHVEMAEYQHVRANPRLEYMPVFREAGPVDMRPFPDIVFNSHEREQLMGHLMGGMQVLLMVVLGLTWYRARIFHREQRNILYNRRAFKDDNEKEKGSRSNRSRGNTSGGGKDNVDEDSSWLTKFCDWIYKVFNFKAHLAKRKAAQADGATTTRKTLLSYFQKNTSKASKKTG